MRNAVNELLRDDYIRDCQRAVDKWNRRLGEAGSNVRLSLPSRRFNRQRGVYSGHAFDPEGNLIDPATFEARRDDWLLCPEDNAYLRESMVPVHEPGKFAHWISPPAKGLHRKPIDFEYVRA